MVSSNSKHLSERVLQILQFFCRRDPKRIADNLKSTEKEESCTTYNMLKVQSITRHSFNSSCIATEVKNVYYVFDLLFDIQG